MCLVSVYDNGLSFAIYFLLLTCSFSDLILIHPPNKNKMTALSMELWLVSLTLKYIYVHVHVYETYAQ